MKISQRGTIKTISARGELGRRIRDMGINPGAECVIVGRAPLYDPVAIKLNGYTVTLRNSEADYISCEVEDE
jgi:ferrous iron transport protein A